MSVFCHSDKIVGRLKQENVSENKLLLEEIQQEYQVYQQDQMDIIGITEKDIQQHVSFYNKYVKFLSQDKYWKWAHAQVKFKSSVFEELMYYLCKDIPGVGNKNIRLGPTSGCTRISFSLSGVNAPEKIPCFESDNKDIDFAIFIEVDSKTKIAGSKKWHEKRFFVPIVFIECKRRFDKTQLIETDAIVKRIKDIIPNCLSMVVADGYFVGESFDLGTTYIDKIYSLKPGRDSDTVIMWEPLFDMVKKIEVHLFTLATHPSSTFDERLKRGIMI